MTGSSLSIRRLRDEDFASVRALADRELARVPEGEAASSAVESALASVSDEYRALVAEDAGEVIGVAVYGPVAGAVGTAKLHAILVTAAARMRGVAARICEHLASEVAREGVRLLVAELPDTGALRPGASLLERCGWREEARVPDFFADGIALRLYRRTLSDEAGP